MSTTLVEREAGRAGGGLPPDARGGSPEGGGQGGILKDPSRFGMLAFLGTITMLFVGFTSAYILREASADWRALPAPGVLWGNTLVLALSSAAVERGRWALRNFQLSSVRGWVLGAGLLATLFLGGQLLAWQELSARGIFLATNPHSSFFYLLTGLHGLHLLGGLVWLAVVATQAGRLRLEPGSDALGLFALYWHFLLALWIYLAFLLFFL